LRLRWDRKKLCLSDAHFALQFQNLSSSRNRNVNIALQEQLLSDMELLKKWLRLDPDLILAKGKNHIFVSKM